MAPDQALTQGVGVGGGAGTGSRTSEQGSPDPTSSSDPSAGLGSWLPYSLFPKNRDTPAGPSPRSSIAARQPLSEQPWHIGRVPRDTR